MQHMLGYNLIQGAMRYLPFWCRQKRKEKRLHAQYRRVAAQRTRRMRRVTSPEYVMYRPL